MAGVVRGRVQADVKRQDLGPAAFKYDVQRIGEMQDEARSRRSVSSGPCRSLSKLRVSGQQGGGPLSKRGPPSGGRWVLRALATAVQMTGKGGLE